MNPNWLKDRETVLLEELATAFPGHRAAAHAGGVDAFLAEAVLSGPTLVLSLARWEYPQGLRWSVAIVEDDRRGPAARRAGASMRPRPAGILDSVWALRRWFNDRETDWTPAGGRAGKPREGLAVWIEELDDLAGDALSGLAWTRPAFLPARESEVVQGTSILAGSRIVPALAGSAPGLRILAETTGGAPLIDLGTFGLRESTLLDEPLRQPLSAGTRLLRCGAAFPLPASATIRFADSQAEARPLRRTLGGAWHFARVADAPVRFVVGPIGATAEQLAMWRTLTAGNLSGRPVAFAPGDGTVLLVAIESLRWERVPMARWNRIELEGVASLVALRGDVPEA